MRVRVEVRVRVRVRVRVGVGVRVRDKTRGMKILLMFHPPPVWANDSLQNVVIMSLEFNAG